MYENYDVVGVRLPNGKIKVMKSDKFEGQIFESESEFYRGVQPVNESVSQNQKTIILDSIYE